MITVFTTTKEFIGLNRINQLNAITSWQVNNLITEILIFGRYKGVEEVEQLEKVKIIEDVATYNDVPFVNHMFIETSKLSKNKILCFLNADIVINKKFTKSLINIHSKVKTNYLIAGQRYDVDFSSLIDFKKPGWFKDFKKATKNNIKIHEPSGSDFFAFPKHQYTKENMPDLLIGRRGWDLWMFYSGLKYGYKVIDLSSTCKVYHLNHDYAHLKNRIKFTKDDPEAIFNLNKIEVDDKYVFHLLASNYAAKLGFIVKNYARWDFKKYCYYSHLLNKKLTWLEKRFVNLLNVFK